MKMVTNPYQNPTFLATKLSDTEKKPSTMQSTPEYQDPEFTTSNGEIEQQAGVLGTENVKVAQAEEEQTTETSSKRAQE